MAKQGISLFHAPSQHVIENKRSIQAIITGSRLQCMSKKQSIVCKLSLLLAVFLIISCHNAGREQGGQSEPSPPGFALFQKKCSACHALQRAINASLDEKKWRKTIRRMRDMHKADISNEEIDRLVHYHVWQQKNESSVFKEKCRKCHPGEIFLEKNLTPAQTRLIIADMQRKAGNTISDEDVELIVNYHIREQLRTLQKSLSVTAAQKPPRQTTAAALTPATTDITALFLVKCSECHEPTLALNVFKDEQAWKNTIARMRRYSKGFISENEADKLVGFHKNKQRREVEAFEKSCTVCHTEERINQRSMSEEEWLNTMKKMQQKAPDLITNEKIEILANFYHRREMTMASLFYDRCDQCHTRANGEKASFSQLALNNLITLAHEKLTSLTPPDVRSLLRLHATRQKREMMLFQKNCKKCHPGGKSNKQKRSAEEWALLISTMQDRPYNEHIQNSINAQIQFHILSRKK